MEIQKVTVYSVSKLYYFWPVWFVSFLFCILTIIYGKDISVLLPNGVEYSIIISTSSTMGTLFFVVLLCSIFFTHVYGFSDHWYLIFVMILTGIVLYFGGLPIYINAHSYFAIGAFSFIPWCYVLFVHDKQAYIVVEPERITYHNHGHIETFDTMGLVIDKTRCIPVPNWIWGLGTESLSLTFPERTRRYSIRFDDVLFINSKLHAIYTILSKRER